MAGTISAAGCIAVVALVMSFLSSITWGWKIRIENILVPYKIWRDSEGILKMQMIVVKADELLEASNAPVQEDHSTKRSASYDAILRASIPVNDYVETYFNAEKFKNMDYPARIPNGTIMTPEEYVDEFCVDLCLDKEGWKRVENFYIDDVGYKWMYNGV